MEAISQIKSNNVQRTTSLSSQSLSPTSRIMKALALMAELRQATLGENTLKIFSMRLATEVVSDPESLEFIEKAIATIADRPRRDSESAFPDMGTVLAETA